MIAEKKNIFALIVRGNKFFLILKSKENKIKVHFIFAYVI